MEKFIKGSAAGIFNQPSNFDITNPLTIFSIRQLEEELRPIAMHIILDYVWNKVKKTLKKRVLVLDEAWYMMKYQDSASFVYSIAKRARKYYLGMTTATQDVEDFLSTDYGKAVLTNSSIQMLLKQGTAEVEMVSNTFFLSEGEKELLVSADVGEGLFFAGQNHVAMKILAAPFEHDMITSNPEDILKQQAAAAAPQPTPLPNTPPATLDTNINAFLDKFNQPVASQQPTQAPVAVPPPAPIVPPPTPQPQPPAVAQPAIPAPIQSQTPVQQPPQPVQPAAPEVPSPQATQPQGINPAIQPPPPPYQAQGTNNFTTAGIPQAGQPNQPQVP
jgi:hypothetical protein